MNPSRPVLFYCRLLAATAILCLGFSAMAEPSTEAVREAMKKEQWDKAKIMLAEVLRDKPNSAPALYFMAFTEARLKHYAESRVYLDRFKKVQPKATPEAALAIQRIEGILAAEAKVDEANAKAWKASPGPAPQAGSLAVESTSGGSNALLYGSGALIAAALAAAVAYGMNRRSRRG